MMKREFEKYFGDKPIILRNDHFVFRSGRHGDVYVNKDEFYLYRDALRKFCDSFIWAWGSYFCNMEAIVSPAVAGVRFGDMVADIFSSWQRRSVMSICVDKDEKHKLVLKRGLEKRVKGRKVIIADDVLHSGATLKELVKIVRQAGGEILAAIVLFNREEITADDLNIPKLVSAIELKFDSWEAKDCPLCKRGVPINQEFGRGREAVIKQIFQVMEEKSKGTGLELIFNPQDDKDA
ncbi:MAG: hypothetical protein COU51_01770 [Parcubacteria group bacterium CG10_big_fil_rev_8_21_14_0_10_36_14]|nr:MAG: hypothetical protein COU51_01770 [Parcubacteria group bacterium CG10_big_fil_rev_8_21_14_0_10_36_14]